MDSSTGGSLKALRRANQERVLRLLLTGGPIHRAEIARRLDVSRATVSTIVGEMLDRGVLVPSEAPRGTDSDGRVRELVALHPHTGIAAGLGFTRDHAAVHLTDLEHHTIAALSASTDPAADAHERIEAGAALLKQALDSCGLERENLLGLGVGVPGQVRVDTGYVGRSLPGQPWAERNVKEMFEHALGMEVMLDNNTRLEGVAEYLWGAGERATTMLYVTLSSGIGSALLDHGAPFRGRLGASGELGHMSVDFDGPVCPCGNRGCLVQKAGAPAILAELAPLLGPDATITDVVAAARAGQRPVLSVLTDVATLVGRMLANVCNLLDPGRVVVGGPLSVLGDTVLDPIRTAIKRHALDAVATETVVVPAAFEEGAASGARGGAALIVQSTPQIETILHRLTSRSPSFGNFQ